MLAIAAITTGTEVLAYNEQSGKNEYQPVLEVFKNQDPKITYLGITDDDSNAISDIPTAIEQVFPATAVLSPHPPPTPPLLFNQGK